MYLGQVIGNVTLSHFEKALKGGRFLLVSPLSKQQLKTFSEHGAQRMRPLSGAYTAVVYDELGAGIDDIIGYVEGVEATMPFDQPTPIDAYNVAIVDRAHYQPEKL